MSTLLAIEKTISSFQELNNRFGLQRCTDESFFTEWQIPVGNLNDENKAFLDHLQQRYRNYYEADLLTEGTILLSIVAPLLERLGFHEPPCFVRSKVPIRIDVAERDEIYRGRIDVLVVRNLMWILTVEAKRSKFAVDIALPQCLAYMSASETQPAFGMVTNGSDFMFCKLENSVYDFSEPFSLLSRHNRLYEVATILSALQKDLTQLT
ncbi:MAG: type I restriction endonuclease subunit R [Cyanobacteria bacterium P01_A01_bin.137]